MKFQKMDWNTLPQATLVQLVLIEMGYSQRRVDPDAFLKHNAGFDLICFFDGEKIIGFAVVEPCYPLFPQCISIEKLRFLWNHNSEEKIRQMVAAVACAYQDTRENIVLDVDKKREMNLELYRTMGFQETILHSPRGGGYCLLLDSIAHLANLC